MVPADEVGGRVRTAGDTDPLAAALAELTALAEDTDRAARESLRDRLAGRRLRVLVAGEAKRGKSTLVNALLRRPLLPMGVTPLTALATTVRYGEREEAIAVFGDGRTESFPLAALGDLVTERGNPGNRRGLASVTVVAAAPLLARGLELVDTPGTGSVYAHNTAEAEAALKTMDAAVFVLTADPPVSASERELMARVAELSVTMFVVLNKADYLAGYGAAEGAAPGGSELAEALEFTAKVAGEATGQPVRIYPLSARAALGGQAQAAGGQARPAGGTALGGQARPAGETAKPAGTPDPGFTVFARDFTSYLERGRDADLRVSVAGHARRLAERLADEVALARRAAQMRTGEAAQRVAAFTERLAAVAARQQDAADLARGESARLLAGLNEAAAQAVRDRTAEAGLAIEALLREELAQAPAAEIERAGRARLAELAVATAEDWRQQQAERLEQGLAQLDARLTGALQAELDAVREAAAELLGLALAVPGPGDRLQPDLRFFYLTGEQAGQTELLAGAIRRRLPGEAGRRRARAYLRRETATLVPQQIGRARADLQCRLAEATRRLVRAAGDRYTESTRRLEGALRAAATARQATAEEAARLDRDQAARQQALDRVLGLLQEAAQPDSSEPGSAG
jgi:GTP-binding protein EngB required for normal cell division